jgi:hypothetical protein
VTLVFRVLVNWLYYPNPGHLLEGLKHAEGYRLAHSDAEIHLLLPKGPVADFVRLHGIAIHTISLDRLEVDLSAVPPVWDYVVTDPRIGMLSDRADRRPVAARLLVARDLAATRFVARAGEGTAPVLTELLGGSSAPVLPYVRNASVRVGVAVPRALRARLTGRPNICVLPAGSTQSQAPSLSTWYAIGRSLLHRFPQAELHFTGVSRRRAGSSGPTAIGKRELKLLARRLGASRVWWNESVATQFALMSACDLLVAPHTGFAFWASALGTPWLALSGCPWPEYLCNGTPLLSVLPDCGSYPSRTNNDAACFHRAVSYGRPWCMEKLLERLDEVVAAAVTLLDPRVSFDDVLDAQLARIDSHPGRDRFFFFDGRDNLRGQPTPVPLPVAELNERTYPCDDERGRGSNR